MGLACGDPSVVAALGRPEDVVDLFDSGHQLLCNLDACMNLCFGAELRCVPEGGVKVRVCLEMWWLEVVGPQNEEFFLRELRLLLFDGDVARLGVCLLYTSDAADE